MITVLHHEEPNDPKDDREPLNIHGPAKNCINYGSINRFQEFRAIQLPPRTAINLLWLSKLSSSVKLHDNSAQVYSQHWFGPVTQDKNLICEASCFHWWVIFAVSSHTAMTSIFYKYVLDMKATLAPGRALLKVSWCTHFNKLATTVMVIEANVTIITGFENTRLHLAHRDSTNTTWFCGCHGETGTSICQMDELVARYPEL